MCGIGGYIDLWDVGEPREVEERAGILDRICRIITHRGPDDQGVMLKPGVALGMRRLSIIDLAGAHQPMSGEDGWWPPARSMIDNRRIPRATPGFSITP